jgi:type IV pilus assembly protein PilM
VKDRFGFEAERGSVAFFKAGEVRRGAEVRDELVVFAGAPAILTPYLQAFMDLGLTVRAIDLQPCAILRGLSRVTPQAECGAVLDIGARSSQLIIHRAGDLAFYKHIEIGAAALDQAVSEKLGVTTAEAAQMRDSLGSTTSEDAGGEDSGMPATLMQAVHDALRPKVEELAREIDMCLRYYVVTFRAARPETLIAVGRQAVNARLLELLSNALGLNVAAGTPLRGVENLTEATRPDRSAEWCAAAGLSLYPVGEARAEAAA